MAVYVFRIPPLGGGGGTRGGWIIYLRVIYILAHRYTYTKLSTPCYLHKILHAFMVGWYMPGGALSSLALAGTTTATRGSGWVTKPQGIRSNHVKSKFYGPFSHSTPLKTTLKIHFFLKGFVEPIFVFVGGVTRSITNKHGKTMNWWTKLCKHHTKSDGHQGCWNIQIGHVLLNSNVNIDVWWFSYGPWSVFLVLGISCQKRRGSWMDIIFVSGTASPAYLHWKSRSETLELGWNFHVHRWMSACLRAILD